MTMRFNYLRFPTRQPVLTLSGRTERPRTVIGLTLIGPTSTRLIEALLDTGSDDTVFPEALAAILGIDLTNAPTLIGAGFGMVAHPLRLAEVTLRVADSQEQREWRAWVGFTAAPLRQPLLGYAGFLQFFTATFHGDREEVELTINADFPGT
jgi:hypothetical protein